MDPLLAVKMFLELHQGEAGFKCDHLVYAQNTHVSFFSGDLWILLASSS